MLKTAFNVQDSFTKKLTLFTKNGDINPVVSSGFLSTRYSSRIAETSARKFWRSYSKQESIIKNAFRKDSQTLNKKIVAVNTDTERELKKFREMVRNEVRKKQKNTVFDE